jgi:hypothetical protein
MFCYKHGCGSGSGLDPDSVTLWIRIRIGNPDPDPEARKSLNRYKIALTTGTVLFEKYFDE